MKTRPTCEMYFIRVRSSMSYENLNSRYFAPVVESLPISPLRKICHISLTALILKKFNIRHRGNFHGKNGWWGYFTYQTDRYSVSARNLISHYSVDFTKVKLVIVKQVEIERQVFIPTWDLPGKFPQISSELPALVATGQTAEQATRKQTLRSAQLWWTKNWY